MPRVIVWDAAELTRPDLETVEALAWLQLCARRSGFRLELRNAPAELAELLCLCGLAAELGLGGCGVDARGQPEHREEAGGVQEEGDPGDPVA